MTAPDWFAEDGLFDDDYEPSSLSVDEAVLLLGINTAPTPCAD